MSTEEIYQNIIEEAESLEQELIKLRREFHQYPEPGWMEMRTSARIAELLESYGCDQVLMGTEVCKADARMGVPEESLLEQHYKEVNALGQVSEEKLKKTRGGFTGVIGILHGKLSEERTASEKASERASENQVLAFRFDIDALPVTECEDKDHFPEKQGFRSICPGYMHACGHDGHATIGLGVAKVLMSIKDQLHGTVKLIFQPAEEGVRGAKSIVDNGHLDGVDYLIGSHVTNKKEDDPAVVIPGSYGSLATTKYDVIFHGKSAHAGGSPEVGRNVMLAVGTAILNLYAIPRHSGGVSRVNVGTVVAGSGRNVIADEAKMEIEVRGETTEINEYMKNYAVNIIESAAKMHGCTCEMKLMGAANSLTSSEALMERVKRVCEEDLHLPVAKEMSSKNSGSEDVSYMMNRVQEQGGQATFMRVLTHEAGPGHSRIFDIDEQVLPNAVKIFCGVVYDIMHE